MLACLTSNASISAFSSPPTRYEECDSITAVHKSSHISFRDETRLTTSVVHVPMASNSKQNNQTDPPSANFAKSSSSSTIGYDHEIYLQLISGSGSGTGSGTGTGGKTSSALKTPNQVYREVCIHTTFLYIVLSFEGGIKFKICICRNALNISRRGRWIRLFWSHGGILVRWILIARRFSVRGIGCSDYSG